MPRACWYPENHHVLSFTASKLRRRRQKAFLTFHDVTFRKTHDLNELGSQCVQLAPALAALFQEAADLNDYAVVFRYLDAPREPDEEEARGTLQTAERVFAVLSRSLTSSGEKG